MFSKLKRRLWAEEDEAHVIQLWAEHVAELRAAKRNSHIYAKIAEELGNGWTGQEVHTKINNLQQKFRSEKKEMGPSGGSPSDWKHYAAVNKIIGQNASNNKQCDESFHFRKFSNSPMPPASPPLMTSPMPPTTPSLFSPQSSETLERPGASSTPDPETPLLTPESTRASFDGEEAPGPSNPKRKRTHCNEMVKAIEKQTKFLEALGNNQMQVMQSVIDNNRKDTDQFCELFKQQSETDKELLQVLKCLIQEK